MRHSLARLVAAIVALTLGDLPCAAGQQTTESETLIRLSVAPAAAPKPALKYMLLPELKEVNPGNPIQGYLKCALEEYHFLFDKEHFERREALLATPLEALPLAELRDYGQGALTHLDSAARLDTPDWQILLKLKADGISTLLPDVQQMRGLSRALSVRFRSEVAIGNFDAAIRSAKTMFAMARHMDDHPTLIGDLVGIAIAAQAIVAIDEMIEQRGCPNLYWALTNLPDPLIGCEKGRAGERLVLSTVFNDLNSERPMTAEQIKKFIDPLDALLDDGAALEPGKRIRAFLEKRAKDPAKVAAARERLIESGLSEQAVRSFPAEQVLLLDEKRECDERFDDLSKFMSFPAWQVEELSEKVRLYKEPSIFADALLPGQYRVRRVQGRLEQRIALLRIVEALRIYASEHNGAFPAKLSEVSVPLPNDPFTGVAFRYESSGKTAHVRGTPPKAEEKDIGYRVHYELTLRE